MGNRPLDNYLRTHRRYSGLLHRDVAFLLGSKNDATVSRHEDNSRAPGLDLALGYEVIFSTPVRELFAGRYRRRDIEVKQRAKQLFMRLKDEPMASRYGHRLDTLRIIAEISDPVVIPLWEE